MKSADFLKGFALLTLMVTSPFSLFSFDYDSEHIPTEFRVVLDPRQSTTISAQINSSVMEIPKEMGDPFHPGDTLIKLDNAVFRATHKKAQFLLERAQEQLSAKKQLFEDNVASAFELKNAQAEAASAEADFITAAEQLNHCLIKAPYAGHVENLLINEHEVIQPGQPLLEIVNDKTLLAKLLIPSYYFDKITLGETLEIQLKETNSSVEAIVTHIGAVIDPASSMMKVFAEVDNRNGQLRAGMTGTTNLEKHKSEK